MDLFVKELLYTYETKLVPLEYLSSENTGLSGNQWLFTLAIGPSPSQAITTLKRIRPRYPSTNIALNVKRHWACCDSSKIHFKNCLNLVYITINMSNNLIRINLLITSVCLLM